MSRGWSILIGIACLAGAAYFAKTSLEFRRHGEVVLGTVISVDAKLSSEDGVLSFSNRAVVQFTPASGGEPLTLRTGWSSALFGSPTIGDSVRVRYLPKEPASAREDSLLFDWLGPLALFILGISGLTGKLRSSERETVWWRSGGD